MAFVASMQITLLYGIIVIDSISVFIEPRSFAFSDGPRCSTYGKIQIRQNLIVQVVDYYGGLIHKARDRVSVLCLMTSWNHRIISYTYNSIVVLYFCNVIYLFLIEWKRLVTIWFEVFNRWNMLWAGFQNGCKITNQIYPSQHPHISLFNPLYNFD